MTNDDIDSTYMKIEKNLFKGNDGIIINLDESRMISPIHLKENTFSQNIGQSLIIRHGLVTDSNSIYEQNIADGGVGVFIMSNSEYVGTGNIFDLNEASTIGGAVTVTT